MPAEPNPERFERHYQLAVKAARKKFGYGWTEIGRTFQRAAIAQEILYILSIQDERAPAESIRAMTDTLARLLVEEFNA